MTLEGNTAQTGESQAADGTESPAGDASQTPAGTDPAAQIEAYRKRQAGADAARAVAEAKAADAEAKATNLAAKLAEATRGTDDANLTETARLQALLDVANERATKAEADATARILDARFPNARKDLPEVTDEVRLAKFEAMLAEPAEASSPAPLGANPQRSQTNLTEETSETIMTRLRGMTPPW